MALCYSSVCHLIRMFKRDLLFEVLSRFRTRSGFSEGVSTVLVQQAVGHEKSEGGVTVRYTHSFQLKDLLPVVDAVSFAS